MNEIVYSPRRAITILVVAAVLLALTGYVVVDTLKPKMASRYIDRGIAYLKAQNFDSARSEFMKADRFRSPEADDWLNRTEVARTDPAELEGYWAEWQVEPVLRELTEARGPFATPKEALTKGIELYNAEQSRFAQYAVDEALKLDPEYPEAWHYRYLIYTKLAADAARYREMAEAARLKRDSLTSLYLNP